MGKQLSLDFVEPAPGLDRQDDRELRSKIRSLTASEARPLGIGKSTLHYMRRNAQHRRQFKSDRKVREKLLA